MSWPNAVAMEHWRRLCRRFLTPPGNVIALPVPALATTVTWTLPRKEVDGNYGAACSPSWPTGVGAVTSATNIVLTFATPAPANASVSIATFRSE
jgi:hypothetical protein